MRFSSVAAALAVALVCTRAAVAQTGAPSSVGAPTSPAAQMRVNTYSQGPETVAEEVVAVMFDGTTIKGDFTITAPASAAAMLDPNIYCTANLTPRACCTGNKTGTCANPNSPMCQNPENPERCCTGLHTGNCVPFPCNSIDITGDINNAGDVWLSRQNTAALPSGTPPYSPSTPIGRGANHVFAAPGRDCSLPTILQGTNCNVGGSPAVNCILHVSTN